MWWLWLLWLTVLDEIEDWLKAEPSETPLVVVDDALITSLMLFECVLAVVSLPKIESFEESSLIHMILQSTLVNPD